MNTVFTISTQGGTRTCEDFMFVKDEIGIMHQQMERRVYGTTREDARGNYDFLVLRRGPEQTSTYIQTATDCDRFVIELCLGEQEEGSPVLYELCTEGIDKLPVLDFFCKFWQGENIDVTGWKRARLLDM